MGLDELYIYAGNERLIDLLLLREAGLLTAAQQQELTGLLQQPGAEGILVMFHIEKPYLSSPFVPEEMAAVEETLVTGKPRRIPLWRTMAIAASVLLAVGGVYWFMDGSKQQPPAVVQAKQKPADVQPGTNKAVLTLANGQQIVLDDASKGSVAIEGNTQVMKLTGGELAYQAAKGTAAAEMVYNTITTPRAGQYIVLLPDGSKVWLNAATRLRFPVAFTGKERVVEMTGEAYFEIAANARQPFRVKTTQQTVDVLGTNFNISAYPEDKTVNTTLLKGSVRVTTNGGVAQYLDPGQQAQSDGQHFTLVKKPDIEEVMAWKNGVFRFNETSLEVIMKQLARWYDVEIVYEHNNKPLDRFVGTIPRNVPLSEVLHLLELTGHVQFSIENSSKILVRY